jgi:hypothetical protein
MANSVYDDVDLESERLLNTRDLRSAELRAITGMDDEKSDEEVMRETEDADDDFSPKKEKATDEEREALGLNETDSDEDDDEDSDNEDNFTYSPRQEKNRNRLMGMISGKRGAGVATLGIAIAAGLGLTTLLAPLKLVGIMKTIDNRFFASTNSVLDEGSRKLVSRYINDQVIPSMSKPGCTSTKINKDCISDTGLGTSPLTQIYRRMRENKYEQKLANAGMEFRRVKDGTAAGKLVMLIDATTNDDDKAILAALSKPNSTHANYFEIIPDPNGSGGTLIRDYRGNTSPAQKALTDKREIRKAMDRIIEDTGHHKRGIFYWKVSGFLQNKYGQARCAVACDKSAGYAQWKTDLNEKSQFLNVKKRAKLAIIAKVVTPVNTGYGLLFEMMASDTDADKITSDDPANRESQTYFEKKMAGRVKSLEAAGEKAGIEKALGLIKTIEGEHNGSFGSFATKTILTKILGEEIAKQAVDTGIPVIGWINTVSKWANRFKKLAKIVVVTRTSIMVAGWYKSYGLLSSHANEITTGDTEGELTQAAVGLIGEDNPSGNPDLTAERSRVFQDIMSSNPLEVVGLFGKSYAQSSATTDGYPCDEKGTYIKPEETVCENEKLGKNNESLQQIGSVAGEITKVTDVYDKSAGKVLKLPGEIASKATSPVINGAIEALGLKPKIEELSNALTEEAVKKVSETNILDTPFTDKINGAQLINAAAAGAEYANNLNLSDVVGVPVDKDGHVTAMLWNEQRAEEKSQFLEKSLYARLFDTNDTMSMINQVALTRPVSRAANPVAYVASLIRQAPSLAANTSQTFASAFAGTSFAAPPTTYASPFGNTVNALAPGDPVFDEILDHGGYTEEECKTMDEEWYKAATIDEATRQTIFHTKNKCRIWKGAMAFPTVSYFSDNPNSDPELTAPDVDEENYGSDGDESDFPPEAVDGDWVRVDGILVDKSIADNLKALLNAIRAEGIPLSGWGARSPAEQIATRKKNCGSSNYAIYDMKSGDCKPPTAKPGSSMHEKGLAIDFFIPDSSGNKDGKLTSSTAQFKWLSANAGKYGFKNLPSEPWHWSTNGR